jgi:hypothetical protein
MACAVISDCYVFCFLQMLYVDNLQHGFFIDSFVLSRCAMLDSPTIDKISAADRRGDTAKDEYGHLRVRFFFDNHHFFCVQSFYHYYLFFLQSYIFLQPISITSTCYAPPVCVPAIAIPTVLASGIPVPAGTAAAAATSVADVTSSRAVTSSISLSFAAAVATSAVGSALPSHDPGGLGFTVLQPPVVPNYPSFTAAFAQSIADVVGRSRKSEAIKVLQEFDMASQNAQKYMTKAAQFVTMSNELMAKAHHECYNSIQKLVAEARADRQAANERRRRPRNTEGTSGLGIFPLVFFIIYSVFYSHYSLVFNVINSFLCCFQC